MPTLDGLKVIRSSIHGYGVVAVRALRAGERIVEGDGIPWHRNDDFDDTYALLMYSGTESEDDDPEMLLDLTDQTRWINHSCDPNTEVDTEFNPETETGRAWWIALRNIEPGEELTYDYAFSAEVAEPCFCGSGSCRGVIVDVDEISDLRPKLGKLVTSRYRRATSSF